MKLRNFIISSAGLLLISAFIAPKALAQRTVLFETFTNEDEPCAPGPTILPARTAFNQSVTDVVNSKGSKIIHFNHHYGNEADNVEYPNSENIATRLGAGNTLFYGAVDRSSQIYSSSNTSVSNRLSLSSDDWSSAIDFEASQPDIADISLVSAQLDTVTLKSAGENILLTNISVTLHQDFLNLSTDPSTKLVIRYAILQDNVKDAQCGGKNSGLINLDDVVRYATIVDTGTFIVTGSSGSTVNVFSNQEINGRTAQLQVPWDYSNLRLIAYLEEAPSANFQVVNSATVVQNMNTLPLPAPSITLIDSAVDGHIFNPGPPGIGVPFMATNVSAVNEYYSLDNGQTWTTIVDSAHLRSWPYAFVAQELPDTEINKTGKIKIVDVDDPKVFYIEKGNFSIHVTPTVNILHPIETDTLTADSTFLVQWSDPGVSSVKLEYTLNPFITWHKIADTVTGSSYKWTVPDTNSFAEFRITDDNDNTVVAISSQPFEILKHIVEKGAVSSGSGLQPDLTITSIAPNPANNGAALVIRYSDQSAATISLDILDLLGRPVASRTLLASSNGEADIPTQNLIAGSYIVRMNDGVSTVTKRVEIIR